MHYIFREGTRGGAWCVILRGVLRLINPVINGILEALVVCFTTLFARFGTQKTIFRSRCRFFLRKFRVPSRFLCANFSKSVPYLGFCSKSGQSRGGTSVFVVQDLVHFYVFFFSSFFVWNIDFFFSACQIYDSETGYKRW